MVEWGDVRIRPSWWARVRFESPTGCWVWQGAVETYGYGCVTVAGKTQRAHRAWYKKLVGSICAGLVLDHLCRQRLCVNPAHLEPVTQYENMRRGDSFLHQKRKTVCAQGHPYDVENTYHTKAGKRACRICQNITQKAYMVRKRVTLAL